MSNDADQHGSLAWPDHDTGPNPPPGVDEDREPKTRRPRPMWDRSKIFLLLSGAWAFLFWNNVAQVPDVPADRVALFTVAQHGWLLVLAGLELVRQIHYLVSERSASYHAFWTRGVFGRFHRRVGQMDDWNRFRVSRVMRILFAVLVLDLILAQALELHPAVAIFQAPVIAWDLLPFILRLAFGFFFVMFQFIGLFWFLSRGGVETYMPEDVKTRFRDVWGQDHVVEKVKENIFYLEDPESIERKGGFIPGGILLWGPPGTGKTLMAEAVAGETGRPFVFVEPGAFMNMFIGVGILKVKGLFRKLRKLALRYGGVIVFFDEADALGNRGAAVAGKGGWQPNGHQGSGDGCNGMSYLSPQTAALVHGVHHEPATEAGLRGGIVNRFVMGGMGGGGGGMGTLQALLTEISGLKKPRGFVNRHVRRVLGMKPKPPPKYRILLMMASNMPQALDPALLRPGRIDRIYKVSYPSKAGRIKTYEGYLSKVPNDLTPEDIEKLATQTPYATGASIKDLVNESLINAIREGRERITWRDVIKARLLKSLGPPEDVEYIERERHAVAVHEACHAVVAYRMRKHLAIDIATIEKGQDYLGMVASIPLEEQFTRWRSEYEADVMVALAAICGEKLLFGGDNSSGVSGDLRSATTVAMFMEGYWGMGDTIGSHAVIKQPTGSLIDTAGGVLESELGRRVETRLGELLGKTQELLERNRREVLAVAHALESHKTLTGEDIVAVIEGREGPLVDGRPYVDPGFMEVAEAYHSQALEAHQGHGQVRVPLPRPTPRGDWQLPVASGLGSPEGSSGNGQPSA